MTITALIGYAAAALSILNQFPQAIKVIKTRDTHSLSLSMYCIVEVCISLWLVYGILLNDLPLIVGNAISLIPITYIWLTKIYHTITGKDPWGI